MSCTLIDAASDKFYIDRHTDNILLWHLYINILHKKTFIQKQLTILYKSAKICQRQNIYLVDKKDHYFRGPMGWKNDEKSTQKN